MAFAMLSIPPRKGAEVSDNLARQFLLRDDVVFLNHGVRIFDDMFETRFPEPSHAEQNPDDWWHAAGVPFTLPGT